MKRNQSESAQNDTPSGSSAHELAESVRRLKQDLELTTAQLCLLDDRLKRVEHNRLFRWFGALMRMLHPLRRFRLSSLRKSEDATYRRLLDAQAAPAGLAPASEHEPDWPTLTVVSCLSSSRSGARNLDGAILSASVPVEIITISSGPPVARDALDPIPGSAPESLAAKRNTAQVPSFAEAISAANGEYILVLNSGYYPAKGAIDRIRIFLAHSKPDVLYFDDDEIDVSGIRKNPRLRPGWSPELLLSGNYLGGAICVRREAVQRVGLTDGSPAPLYDFSLRLMEAGGVIEHLPEVLIHRPSKNAWSDSLAERDVLRDAIQRIDGAQAICNPILEAHCFSVLRPHMPVLPITAIICSASEKRIGECLESLRNTAGDVISRVIVVAHESAAPNHALRSKILKNGAELIPYRGRFNFSKMNNLAAMSVATGAILFLNDDVRATEAGWARYLAETVSRPSIGVAGTLLHYPNSTIQHAGIVLGINDGAGHAGRFSTGSSAWPWLHVSRNVTAVTGACLAIPAALFHALGGLDEAFPENYNDVDLCLRVREAGYEIVCVAAKGLIHEESQTRRPVVHFHERHRFFSHWSHWLLKADRYHHPALAPTEILGLNPTYDEGFRAVRRA